VQFVGRVDVVCCLAGVGGVQVLCWTGVTLGVPHYVEGFGYEVWYLENCWFDGNYMLEVVEVICALLVWCIVVVEVKKLTGREISEYTEDAR